MSDDDKKKDAEKKASAFIDKLFEGFPAHQRQRLMESHFLQDPEEKKARLKLIQELSLELAEVRKQERFVLFGETAIEAVIEGDWKGVADRIDWLTFRQESFEQMQHMAPIWAKFREMLQIACVEARHRRELLMKHVLGQKEEN